MWWMLSAAWAGQDVPLSAEPVIQMLATEEGTPRGLPATSSEVSLGVYPVDTGAPHVWHGALRHDVGLARFGRGAWTGGLAVETVADDDNDISFRLVRLFYDAHLGAAYRWSESSVGWLSWRHQCSHGTDDVAGRILIRSGPELGVRREGGGATRWSAMGVVQGTVIGQNRDDAWQPRGQVAGSGTIEVPVRGSWSFVAGTGLGLMAVGTGSGELWTAGSTWGDVRVVPLPRLEAGFRTAGPTGWAKFGLAYERIEDSGIGDAADPAHLALLRIDLGAFSSRPGT